MPLYFNSVHYFLLSLCDFGQQIAHENQQDERKWKRQNDFHRQREIHRFAGEGRVLFVYSMNIPEALLKCINNNLLFRRKIICFVINWSFLIYVWITLLIICFGRNLQMVLWLLEGRGWTSGMDGKETLEVQF